MDDEDGFLACWDWMDSQPMIFYLIDLDEAGIDAAIAQEVRSICYRTYAKYYDEDRPDATK